MAEALESRFFKDRFETAKKDLVYSPRRGLIDFTVPLFGSYLRRQHPLASLDIDG